MLVPQWLIDNLFASLMEAIVEGLRWAALGLLNVIIWMIETSPEPDLTSTSWFMGPYSTMVQFGIWLAVPFVLIATIIAIFKGGLSEVIKTYLVAVPIAVLGGVAVIALLGLVQNITNGFTDQAIVRMREDFDVYFAYLSSTEEVWTDIDAAFSQIIVFGITVILTLLLVLELVVRSVAIYMAVLFIPLSLGAAVWQTSRVWVFRLIETAVVLIASKFVIVAVMGFGFAIIRSGVPLEEGDDTTLFGTLVPWLVGASVIFISTAATPILLAMMLSQGNSDSATSRKALQSTTPIDADNTYVRGRYVAFGKHLAGKGGK